MILSNSGCGPRTAFDGQPPVAVVDGTVSYRGKPVANANISFFPQEEGEAGAAITDQNGRYQVSTYQRFDGAVLGEHIVTVNVPTAGPTLPGAPEAKEEAGVVPKIYRDRETSPLKVVVMPNITNKFDFDLND